MILHDTSSSIGTLKFSSLNWSQGSPLMACQSLKVVDPLKHIINAIKQVILVSSPHFLRMYLYREESVHSM